jgi:hypothetical protein
MPVLAPRRFWRVVPSVLRAAMAGVKGMLTAVALVRVLPGQVSPVQVWQGFVSQEPVSQEPVFQRAVSPGLVSPGRHGAVPAAVLRAAI